MLSIVDYLKIGFITCRTYYSHVAYDCDVKRVILLKPKLISKKIGIRQIYSSFASFVKPEC